MNNKQMNLLKLENVERIVGKCFIRVVKNHNTYGIFKKSLNQHINNRKGSDGDNPICRCKDFNDFLTRVNQITNKDFDSHKREGTSYEYVTMLINHLLHNLLENGGVDPRRLGEYGQEIFDLSCYSMYGNQFLEDMERMKREHPMNGKIPSDIDQELKEEYISRLKHGEKMSFDQFMMHYHRDILEGEESDDNNQEEESDWDDFLCDEETEPQTNRW